MNVKLRLKTYVRYGTRFFHVSLNCNRTQVTVFDVKVTQRFSVGAGCKM